MPFNESKNILTGNTDMDSDETRVGPNKTVMLYNLTNEINEKSLGDNSGHTGDNYEVLTPYEGTAIFSDGLPGPDPNRWRTTGSFESKNTKKIFTFCYNTSTGLSLVYTAFEYGAYQTIWTGNLGFSPDPKFFMAEGRVLLKQQSYVNNSGEIKKRSFLIFTDNINDIRCISVEDAINTGGFSTSNPRFNCVDPGWDPVYLLNLGVPPPYYPTIVTTSAALPSDTYKQNVIKNRVWRFRTKYIDVFERASEHSIISDPFITSAGGACASDSDYSKCLFLTIPGGNPLVNKIQIEVSLWGSGTDGLNGEGEWKLYDTIYKYMQNDYVEWYQQSINPDIVYNAGLNTITYRFCGDKETVPIAVSEVSRLFNPLPLTSSGVTSVENRLACVNNLKGFNQLPWFLLKNIQFQVNTPEDSCGVTKNRTIKFYAVIISAANQNRVGWFYKRLPQDADWWRWGFEDNVIKNHTNQYSNYNGFPAYIAGTNYTTVSTEMVFAFADGSLVPRPPGYNPLPADNGRIIVHEFKFTNVKPGIYGCRIGNPAHLVSDPNLQKTSTYLGGQTSVYNFATWFQGGGVEAFIVPLDNEEKTLVVNVCNGDYNDFYDSGTGNLMVIYDLCKSRYRATGPYVIDGYVLEDEISNIPIENQLMTWDNGGGPAANPVAYSMFTDHNGYFFQGWAGVDVEHGDVVAARAIMNVELCGAPVVKVYTEYYGYLDNGDLPPSPYESKYFTFTGGATFPANSRRIIKGSIKSCSGTSGIRGGVMLIKDAQFATTDANGNYTLIVHNRDAIGIYLDKLILTPGSGCQLSRCDNPCSSCFPILDIPYKQCQGDRTYTVDTIFANIIGSNLSGPQTGGRYGLAVIAHDWMGRCSAAQVLPEYFLDIPSIVETGVFKHCTISFTIGSAFFPNWVKGISFAITNNLNYENFLCWAVDLVDFIDDAGNIVSSITATQIKIYYKSLIEYSKKNSLSTNATWDFITTGTNENDVPVLGDYVEFIMNGAGSFFAPALTSLVKFDSTGIFIQVEYTEDLAGLTSGALIKILRPKDITNEYSSPYFELNPMIPVVANSAQITSGTFTYADSYFLQRVIPVPTTTVTSQSGNVTKTITTLDQGSTGQETKITKEVNGVETIEISSTENISTSYPFLFEHHSPSDFWGDHAHTKGRVFFRNPYERQRRNIAEVALSAPLLYEGNYNGLHYFDEDLMKSFLQLDCGEIVVMIGEVTTFLIICERDHYVVGYNNNQITINAQRQAVGGQQGFGNPEQKRGENYGCDFSDVSTIRREEGRVLFVDRSNFTIILSDYISSKRIDLGQVSGYLRDKIEGQNNIRGFSNDTKVVYFVAGIDPVNNRYYLTSFTPNNNGEGGSNYGYFNQYYQTDIFNNETFVFDIMTGAFKGFVSFTPEYYVSARNTVFGKNFMSYRWGATWRHHRTHYQYNVPFNNFYGGQCKKVIAIVVNDFPEKEKKYQYVEVYSDYHKMVSISSVTTESKQISSLPAALWDKADDFYFMRFMCDLNTFFDPALSPVVQANPLYEGNLLKGKWMRLELRSTDEDDPKYCKISAICVYFITSEKSSD